MFVCSFDVGNVISYCKLIILALNFKILALVAAHGIFVYMVVLSNCTETIIIALLYIIGNYLFLLII